LAIKESPDKIGVMLLNRATANLYPVHTLVPGDASTTHDRRGQYQFRMDDGINQPSRIHVYVAAIFTFHLPMLTPPKRVIDNRSVANNPTRFFARPVKEKVAVQIEVLSLASALDEKSVKAQ
jgi:hypothetical protein